MKLLTLDKKAESHFAQLSMGRISLLRKWRSKKKKLRSYLTNTWIYDKSWARSEAKRMTNDWISSLCFALQTRFEQNSCSSRNPAKEVSFLISNRLFMSFVAVFITKELATLFRYSELNLASKTPNRVFQPETTWGTRASTPHKARPSLSRKSNQMPKLK